MPPTTDHEELDARRKVYDTENARLTEYRQYARGEQANVLTVKQAAILGADSVGTTDHERADNICHQVISEHADRIELLGIEIEGEDDEKNAGNQEINDLRDYLDELWVKCQLPALSGQQGYASIRDGNAAVFVRWKPNGDPPTGPDYGRIVLTLEEWWDAGGDATLGTGGEGVWCWEGDEDSEAFSVKEVWHYPDGLSKTASRRKRRYVYYDDRIERFESVTSTGKWEPAPDKDGRYPDGVQPWLKPDGTGLGIPLVPFVNAERMWMKQGMSLLAGGGRSMQDDINLVGASATAAAVLTAFQVLWAKGFTPRKDNEGKPILPVIQIEPGTFILEGSPDFGAGAIPAGEMTQILAGYAHEIAKFCRNTRTPRHSITGGDWPSGDALMRAEQPAVNAAKTRAATWGPAWATVMHRAVEQANVFGRKGLNEDLLLSAKWNDFERRDAIYTLQVERAEWALEQDKEMAQNGAMPPAQQAARERVRAAAAAQGQGRRPA